MYHDRPQRNRLWKGMVKTVAAYAQRFPAA